MLRLLPFLAVSLDGQAGDSTAFPCSSSSFKFLTDLSRPSLRFYFISLHVLIITNQSVAANTTTAEAEQNWIENKTEPANRFT